MSAKLLTTIVIVASVAGSSAAQTRGLANPMTTTAQHASRQAGVSKASSRRGHTAGAGSNAGRDGKLRHNGGAMRVVEPVVKKEPPSDASVLLRAWGRGDLRARDDLLPLVYRQLRQSAAAYLRRERVDHTLQPTALVHEAYLRLVGQNRVAWQNRCHFFGVAAQMMRRVLVDCARERLAAKRPSAGLRVAFDDRLGAVRPPDVEVLLLEQALEELTVLDPRQGQIVELRYFGGLSESEVAETLSISRSTVTREWQMARAWLYRRVVGKPAPGAR
jgi:RNA polymerase sigma factor (TIGR02999 family)